VGAVENQRWKGTAAVISIPDTISFDTALLRQLAVISDLSCRCRSLAFEIGVAQSSLPELATEAQTLAAQLDALLPSRLVAFPDAVRDLFMARRRNELITAALRASRARLETQLAAGSAQLGREIQDLIDALAPQCCSETRAALRACVVPGELPHANAAQLLAFCRAHGACIEEGKP
jgi:hypothetical protein